MTSEEKIDYMIQSLQLAKDEIAYAKIYKKLGMANKEYVDARNPNGTVIRESLKMVGRMANIVANDVSLSPYCNELFKNK